MNTHSQQKYEKLHRPCVVSGFHLKLSMDYYSNETTFSHKKVNQIGFSGCLKLIIILQQFTNVLIFDYSHRDCCEMSSYVFAYKKMVKHLIKLKTHQVISFDTRYFSEDEANADYTHLISSKNIPTQLCILSWTLIPKY